MIHSSNRQCRLLQHLVEIKTAICRVAELVPDLGTETQLYSSLPGEGGDPTGYQSHCQKSRSQGHAQVNTQQVCLFRLFIFPFTHSHDSFFWAVSEANLVNVSINPPLSPSKIHLICSASCPITTSVPSNCVPTIFWRLSIPVCMTVRSKAPRQISSLPPSRPVTLRSNFMSH